MKSRLVLTLAACLLSACLAGGRAACADESPPRDLAPLVAASDISWDYFRRDSQPGVRDGMARWSMSLPTKFSYRCTWRRRDGRIHVRVKPAFEELELTVRHTIRVPHKYRGRHRWGEWLVRHELDHVAISSDPRPRMLFRHMLANLAEIRREVSEESQPDHSMMVRIIEEECKLRREAVFALIRHNYKRLDEATLHGTVGIPDRREFFGAMYGKDRLDDAKFPYFAEVADLVESVAYVEAKLLHSPRSSVP